MICTRAVIGKDYKGNRVQVMPGTKAERIQDKGKILLDCKGLGELIFTDQQYLNNFGTEKVKKRKKASSVDRSCPVGQVPVYKG